MPTGAPSHHDQLREDEVAELQAVLSSKSFARAPALARVLDYVCTEYFAGRADAIKEYNIAVQALGRRPSFNPAEDSIVRVEVSRIRKRLLQYYETEGATHKLQLILAGNGYCPKFSRRDLNAPITPDTPALDATLSAPEPPEAEPAPIVVAGDSRRRILAGAGILLAIIVLLAVGLRLLFRSPAPAPDSGKPSVPSPAFGAVAEPEPIRIAVGLKTPKYVDASGHIWTGDAFYSGGETVSRPDQKILRTLDPPLYQQARLGDFKYDIPLKPGVYELHLHFVELLLQGSFAYGGEGIRKANVSANGKPLLTDFDIALSAPGLQVADEKVFTDISPAEDGLLHLQFSSSASKAILSGIEILPGTSHQMLPVRIVTRYRGHFDRNGGFWESDRYSQGGTGALRTVPVSGTDEPGLYSSERFGYFSYFIPVAGGRYTVTLRFAESTFGLDRLPNSTGNPGRRFFDILCNGTPLVRELDVLKEAGGPNKALEKRFSGLKPNAQNKLVLTFAPVADQAMVRSIEVVEEKR